MTVNSSLSARLEKPASPTKLLQEQMDLENDKELKELAAIENDLLKLPKSPEIRSNPFDPLPLSEDGSHNPTWTSQAPGRHSCPSMGARALAPERPTNPIVKDSQWLRMQEDSTESGDDSYIEQITLAFPICGLNNQWESRNYCHSFEETATKL